MTYADRLTLSQVAALFPTRPHTGTIWRWCHRGVKGVKLAHVRAGRRILIRREDVDDFCERVQAAYDADARAVEDADDGDGAKPRSARAPRPRTDKGRNRDRADAERRCERAAI